MQPTSTTQFETTVDGGVPGLEQVTDRLWAIGMPMLSGQPGLEYNLAYVLRDDDDFLHVIDPGWDTPDNRIRLAAALAEIGGPVRTVSATHHHPDHLGLGAWLRENHGAILRLHRAELEAADAGFRPSAESLDRWAVPMERHSEMLAVRSPATPRIEVDELFDGAETALDIPGWDVRAILTPGHTVGHTSFRLADTRMILTGDLLLPMVFPGIGLGGRFGSNPIRAYFDSLAKVAAYDDHEVLPGHGYRFLGLADGVAETRAHHSRRTDEVRSLLKAAPHLSVWEIASRLSWTRGWDALAGPFLYSALSQTANHIEYATMYPEATPERV